MAAELTPWAAGLRALHESGLSWGEIAESLGYAPGQGTDFVRKVASGAKRGANLAEQVDELVRVGKVRAPVQRRASREGTAKVRGKRGQEARPAHQRKAPPASTLTASGGWRETVKVEPTPARITGKDEDAQTARQESGERRELDREALLSLVRRASQGRRRVAFRVWMGSSRGEPDNMQPVELYMKGGRSASDVLREMRGEGDDPLAWLGALPDDAEPGEDDDTEGEMQRASVAGSQYLLPEWLEGGKAVDVVQVEVIAFGKRAQRR